MRQSRYEPASNPYWLEIKDYTEDAAAHNKSIYFYIWCRDKFVASAYADLGEIIFRFPDNTLMSTLKDSIEIIEAYFAQRKT